VGGGEKGRGRVEECGEGKEEGGERGRRREVWGRGETVSMYVGVHVCWGQTVHALRGSGVYMYWHHECE